MKEFGGQEITPRMRVAKYKPPKSPESANKNTGYLDHIHLVTDLTAWRL